MRKVFSSVYAIVILATVMTLSGCQTALEYAGKTPEISPVEAPNPPIAAPPGNIDALYPSRNQERLPNSDASLWQNGPQSLFGDRRARATGDVLTVVVEINDQAQLNNQTNLNRTASENVSVPAFFGLGTLAQQVLPGGAGLDRAVEVETESVSNGNGILRRQEQIVLRLAATVRHVLPNGNLLIQGSQQVRVNRELRDLQVTGIIRTTDIARNNEITYDKIAEARISYGGRGTASDIQDPRYGQKILDTVLPF